MDFKTYLVQLFRPNEGDKAAADNARKPAKWFFDFTRNLVILGVLKYIATKSSSTFVHVFYYIAAGVMWAYLYSFVQGWRFQPFNFLSGRPEAMLNFVSDIILSTLLTVALNWALNVTVDEIAKA